MSNQFTHQTIKKSVSCSGIGIHSGQSVTMTLHPSYDQPGIFFRRIDQDHTLIPASYVQPVASERFTCLRSDVGIEIHTPEHLLSACAGLSITHLIIDIDQTELPIMDGSAQPFVDLILSAGIQALDSSYSGLLIEKPLFCSHQKAKLMALPDQRPKFTYYLSYPDTFIGDQVYHFDLLNDDYQKDISPARTYGFLSEVQALLDQGLAKGGSLDHALVIDTNDYVNPPRFSDELARHKLLDLMGDLWLLNRPIIGHVISIGGGHRLNATLLASALQHPI